MGVFSRYGYTEIRKNRDPCHLRQTEPGPALHVALQIMISLKSLFSSFPRPIHFPCSCALPPSHCLSLSRCFSHPALLHSQSLKIKEIKHRYRVLACRLPWCKGETISLLYFINPLSLSLLLVLFLPAPEKTMLIVMMFCPPPALVHSLPPPATHQPLASISCFSVDHPKATKKDHFHNLYSTLVTWITRKSSFPRSLQCSSPALPLSPCFTHPALLSTALLTI